LAEEVHLVEEQVLGLQRVAVSDVHRRPPEFNGSACRRDIAVGGVEHTIMGARDGPFGRCSRPVSEELRNLEAKVRECFREHGEEVDDIVAAAQPTSVTPRVLSVLQGRLAVSHDRSRSNEGSALATAPDDHLSERRRWRSAPSNDKGNE
jgi:hypothetical protein